MLSGVVNFSWEYIIDGFERLWVQICNPLRLSNIWYNYAFTNTKTKESRKYFLSRKVYLNRFYKLIFFKKYLIKCHINALCTDRYSILSYHHQKKLGGLTITNLEFTFLIFYHLGYISFTCTQQYYLREKKRLFFIFKETCYHFILIFCTYESQNIFWEILWDFDLSETFLFTV